MRPVILDTDILSYIVEERFETVNLKAKQYLRIFQYFTITTLSVTEVVSGLERTSDYERLQTFYQNLENLEVLAMGTEEAIMAGKITAALFKAGQQIGRMDPLIASIAICNRRPLVTNNTRHYQRIQHLGFPLDLENWRTDDIRPSVPRST